MAYSPKVAMATFHNLVTKKGAMMHKQSLAERIATNGKRQTVTLEEWRKWRLWQVSATYVPEQRVIARALVHGRTLNKGADSVAS